MSRFACLSAVCIALLVGWQYIPASTAPRPPSTATVSPPAGGRWTKFEIPLRAPFASDLQYYELRGRLPSFRCRRERDILQGVEENQRGVRAGRDISWSYGPPATYGWCPGVYRGRVKLARLKRSDGACGRNEPPPRCYGRERLVARFSFRVKPRNWKMRRPVPRVVGLGLRFAECELGRALFRWRYADDSRVRSEMFCGEFRRRPEYWYVREQRPSAGSKATRGSVVVLTLGCDEEPEVCEDSRPTKGPVFEW
jgi:hypothetical protein